MLDQLFKEKKRYVTGEQGHTGGVATGQIEDIDKQAQRDKKDMLDYLLSAQSKVGGFVDSFFNSSAPDSSPSPKKKAKPKDSSDMTEERYQELSKKRYLPRGTQMNMILHDLKRGR